MPSFFFFAMECQSVVKFHIPDSSESTCQYNINPGTDGWYSVVSTDSVNKKIVRVYETREPFDMQQNGTRLKIKTSCECIAVTGMFKSYVDAKEYSENLQTKLHGKVVIHDLLNICILNSKNHGVICWVNSELVTN